MFATRGMRPWPLPSWYLYTTDTSSVRLLTDDDAPSPELSTEPARTRTRAELTAAIHAAASRLGEHELPSCGTSNSSSRCSAGAGAAEPGACSRVKAGRRPPARARP